jgi:hypothetical protein
LVQVELAEDLEQYLIDNPALPYTKLFSKMWKKGGAKMIKHDLNQADIQYETDGGFADFHSLRYDFGSILAAKNVHPKTIQDLMRHSGINLTMSRYTHTLREQQAKTIESLQKIDIGWQRQVRTGTTDIPENLSENPIKIRINPIKFSTEEICKAKDENNINPYKSSISQENSSLRPARFELTTPGLGNRCSILLSYERLIQLLYFSTLSFN